MTTLDLFSLLETGSNDVVGPPIFHDFALGHTTKHGHPIHPRVEWIVTIKSSLYKKWHIFLSKGGDSFLRATSINFDTAAPSGHPSIDLYFTPDRPSGYRGYPLQVRLTRQSPRPNDIACVLENTVSHIHYEIWPLPLLS